MGARILAIDDEPDLLELVRVGLTQAGYVVETASTGSEALASLRRAPADLILLDVMLPDISGTELCSRIRADQRLASVPIIMLTAKSEEIDRVVGLEVGADDYVTKPFDLRELLARIKAVLRRLAPDDLPVHAEPALPSQARPAPHAPGTLRETLRFAGWELDTAARSLTNPQGIEVVLTSGEFALLCAFAQHAGRVLSRDFLLEQTRGREAGPFDRTIDVQVGRLRKKLEADAEDPKIIKSVRGAGYIMVPPVGTA